MKMFVYLLFKAEIIFLSLSLCVSDQKRDVERIILIWGKYDAVGCF